MKILAYTILTSVVIILFALGFFIMRFAIVSDNNFYLATVALDKFFRPKAVSATLALAELDFTQDVTVLRDVVMSKSLCFPDFSLKSMRVKVSVVDFLYMNEIDSSFESRGQFADFFDIQDYRGTRDQNLELLKLLKLQAELCKIVL